MPAGVDEPMAIVSVELPFLFKVAGLKVAVAPAGNPETEKVTVSEKPPVTVIEVVYVAD